MSHEDLKEMLLSQGKQLGYQTSDLKVLSTDPYFVGTSKDYTDAEWIAALWDKMMATRKKPLHLRGFHYWIQSQGIKKPGGVKYAHVDPAKDWLYLLHSTQVARYLGIGQWKNLVDLKHPEPRDYDNYFVGHGLKVSGEIDVQALLSRTLENLVNEILGGVLDYAPRYHADGYQLYHCEVWCEKNSMGFVIDPSCKRFGACYQPLVGQSSVEKVNLAYHRAIKAAQAGKKVRIFYIADWDRYGHAMVSAVARKIEFFSEGQELDIKLSRLALSDEHIDKFNLPKAPKHGEAVVELDALEAIHPGELGKIVDEALKPYHDYDKPKQVEQENKRIRERCKELIEEKLRPGLEEAFDKVSFDGLGDFTLTTSLDDTFAVPEPGHGVAENGAWVLDTSRSYWEQLEEYKRYKASRVEEEA